jgi:hypothetical protein
MFAGHGAGLHRPVRSFVRRGEEVVGAGVESEELAASTAAIPLPGPPKASRVKRAKTLAIAIVDIHGFTDVSQVFKSSLTYSHVVFIKLGAEILERNSWLPSLCQIRHILDLIIWKFAPEKPYCTSKFILDGSKFHGRYPFMGLGVQ